MKARFKELFPYLIMVFVLTILSVFLLWYLGSETLLPDIYSVM